MGVFGGGGGWRGRYNATERRRSVGRGRDTGASTRHARCFTHPVPTDFYPCTPPNLSLQPGGSRNTPPSRSTAAPARRQLFAEYTARPHESDSTPPRKSTALPDWGDTDLPRLTAVGL